MSVDPGSLSEAELHWLRELGSTLAPIQAPGSVEEVRHYNALRKLGLVMLCYVKGHGVGWVITSAGRAALNSSGR